MLYGRGVNRPLFKLATPRTVVAITSTLLALIAALFVLGAGGAAGGAGLHEDSVPPLVAKAGTETSRSCYSVNVPGANDGSLMELDIFGRPAPSCSFSAERIRLAVKRLPENTWGRIGHWRCVWELPAAFCGWNHLSIYASNPGD